MKDKKLTEEELAKLSEELGLATDIVVAYAEYSEAMVRALLESKDNHDRRVQLLAGYIAAHAATMASMMGLEINDCILAMDKATDLHKGAAGDMAANMKKPVTTTPSKGKINWGDS